MMRYDMKKLKLDRSKLLGFRLGPSDKAGPSSIIGPKVGEGGKV